MRILLLVSIILLSVSRAPSVLAQTPTQTSAQPVDTVEPGATGTPTMTATSEPVKTPVSPPVATPNVAPPLPVVVVSTDASIGGTILEDDGNGVASPGDRPAGTLVDLVSVGNWAFSVYTTSNGSFEFTNVPPGEAELWVWWGPGFINVSAFPGHADLFRTAVAVDPDGTVRAAVPDRFLVEKNTTGAVPFPVRTGPGGGPVPVGSIDVGAELARRAPALPSAGTGGGGAGAASMALLYAAVGASVALGLGGVLLRRRAKARARR